MPRGISKFRSPAHDPVLMDMLNERGLDDIPLFSRARRNLPETAWRDAFQRWDELAPDRDGPVRRGPVPVDPTEMTAHIKDKALKLGADDVGITALTPIMVNEGRDVPHRNAVSLIIAERYSEALGGALAVEMETINVYVRCAEISTALGKYIRDELGYPAMADHNATLDLQAIPTLTASGLGEMGKHGSLIHRAFGASFRPAFVTTDLPLATDAPDLFGVQDYCMKCKLCEMNCPAEAIPTSVEHILTDGYKRWLTDVEKCYTASRLREEYCHICVDVCPYVHKENGDRGKQLLYKLFMSKRRKAGWRTPQWFIEDEDEVLAKGADRQAVKRPESS